MRRLKEFLVEARRRRVFRVAAIYIVGAWVVLQVADLAFEAWGIPSEALRFVWIGAVIGFPVALVFGWRFDIVGGRIVHTPASGAPADLSLRRSDYVILAALAAVGVATVYGVGTEISAVRAPDSDPAIATSIDPKSIAVLPFDYAESEPERADLLAKGIQDELLTRLSKIAALKVISRTSVERYRGTTKTVPAIGRELGVGKILEGAVQQSGDQIRVNVQLIDAETDEHLWADTYDRIVTASDVFRIQTEIVETIALELEATLTPEETRQLSSMPTQNMSAYTEYLKGRQLAVIESIQALNAAIAHFDAAIDLDPEFALAHVARADAYLTLGMNFAGGLEAEESNALAEPSLVRALAIDPNLGEAYASLGLLRHQQGNLPAAEEAFKNAIRLRPNYPRVFRLYGRMRWEQGDREEAAELMEKALSLDPYSVPVNYNMARIYDENGEFDEALDRYLRVIEIEPNHAFAYVYIAAIHYLVYGRADESLVWYRKAADNDALSPSLQAAQAIAYLEVGDAESARIWVNRALELGPRTYWAIWTSALLNFYEGDHAAAERDARTMLEVYPQEWGPLYLLRNADIAAGRYEVAASRYARAYRELTEPEVPAVDASNYFAAVDLALVLMHLDKHERANDLLERSLAVIDTLPRLGTSGYWITDVRIFALQGRRDRALAALQQAIDEGWRLFSWFYLEHDPNLDSIRDTPEFDRLYQVIKDDLAVQARRVRDLKASGELAPIR